MSLTDKEELLVELVHYLASGSQEEMGLTLKEVRAFLNQKIKAKGNRTPVQCLEKDGKAFINELKIYINSSED